VLEAQGAHHRQIPFSEAGINAVAPAAVLAFTSAFAASEACTTSGWPCCEAIINAVAPSVSDLL
jgi:hypothetical protein